MNKDKEVEVVDLKEVEIDLMEKVVDLTILCKIRENMNGRMMKRTRSSGKVIIHTKEVLEPTKEEVILILEVVFMAIISDVVKRDIDLLNVDPLKVSKVIEMF